MSFVASEYSNKELVLKRIPPMVDGDLYEFMKECTHEHTADMPNLLDDFKTKINEYVFNNNVNKLSGSEQFKHRNICIGCTQYIDDLYQTYGSNNIMTLENDYKYHCRLNTEIKF